MAHVCPWWGGYFIDNRLRRLFHDPKKIVGPYVLPGMTVMDVGCGMGIFSIAMAKMVGERGRVIAVDLQQQMLDELRRRAVRAGVADRITTHKCETDHFDVEVQVDFALASMMVHEVPDQRRLFDEVRKCLKKGGVMLMAEPKFHVTANAFNSEVTTAKAVGLSLVESPRMFGCRTMVLERV